MVFVPWGDHGICKFWMLKPDRCFNGDKCRFRHPAEADRGRMWDEQLAVQAAERNRSEGGVPPPPPVSASHSQRRSNRNFSAHGKNLTTLRPYQSQEASSNGGHPFPRVHLELASSVSWDRNTCMLEPRAPSDRKRSPSVYRTEHGDGDACSPHNTDDRDDFRPATRYRIDMEHEPRTADDQRSECVIDDHSYDMAGWRDTQAEDDYIDGHRVGTYTQQLFQPGTSSKLILDHGNDEIFQRVNDHPKHNLPTENANHLPLGKHNRLLARAPIAASSSVASRSTSRVVSREMRNIACPTEVEVESGRSEVSTAADVEMGMEAPAGVFVQLGGGRGQHLDLNRTFYDSKFKANTLSIMGAIKRMSNGEAKVVGPHPSTIRVAAPYASEAALEKKLRPSTLDNHDKSLAEAREENIRLQGVAWLDTTRRALQLPIRTFTTACVYYHKFRLAHSGIEYNWADAAAASLLTSCKVEDTLKKSKDILAAAYNAKASGLEQLGSDDSIFEAPSRVVIGLERLVLEAGGFDFRSRYPHKTLVKVARTLPASQESIRVAKVAYTILTDLHRTFAPLKQISATLALASLELATLLSVTESPQEGLSIRDEMQAIDLAKWSTTREEVMETLLDALDLYTHHTTATVLGSYHSLEDFLQVRLSLNKECAESNLPRHTTAPEPSLERTTMTDATLRVTDGHPTPVSPPQPDSQAPSVTASNIQSAPEATGTLRFMLSPQLAADEQTEVRRYFVEEWEDYDEEVEIPLPRPRQTSRERERERERPRDLMDRRPVDLMDDRRAGPMPPARDDRHRDRAIDRDRLRYDRRYDDRDRRFDDRRDRRFDDRRYDDDRRRRDDRR